MDMVREQAGGPTLTDAQRRKIEKDKTRARRGNIQRKRLHVLNNPSKLAFRGWEDVPEPWTYADCEEYIEWCHIDKKFPPERHRKNRKSNKANLRFCSCPDFTQRCIEVYQVLYGRANVERNEIVLYICRMVWAEVVLKKKVDWRTIKQAKNITMPEEPDIPTGVLRFPKGGLNFHKLIVGKEDEEDNTEESEEDNDSDGSRPHKVHTAPGPKRALKTLRGQKRPRVHEGQPSAPPTEVLDESVTTARPANDIPSTMPTLTNETPSIDPIIHTSITPDSSDVEDLKSQLEAKDVIIARLQDEVNKLLRETEEKSSEIAQQALEIMLLRRLQSRTPVVQDVVGLVNESTHALDTSMLVDNDVIENVVATATAGVLEDIRTPVRKRASIALPPRSPPVPYFDSQETQDSLSFPVISTANDVNAAFEPRSQIQNSSEANDIIHLRQDNNVLRKHIYEMSEQYYHWKVACILTVDRNRQIAMEMEKINKEYREHNLKRDFGLTSWAHTDELFPWTDIPTKKVGNLDIIDWAKCGWDYENATSSHHLQGKPSRKLWPNPARFISDGTVCPVCQNGFGPEGGMALGSCQCIYHPMCLISIFLVRRFCALCRSPFHERLYELFGLTRYMPPSWEKDPVNTPGESMAIHWGEDLIWNWRQGTHSVYKTNVSPEFGWENDHEEIVRVCNALVGKKPQDQGKRNFFYQTLNGYWDSTNKKFQFGTHPDGYLWDVEGSLITDLHGHAPISLRTALQYSESEWKEKWRKEAIDFLLEQHSPETRRALDEMMNSQTLRTILETDGPAKRTRAKIKRCLVPITTEDRQDGAGPSGTSNDPMDLTMD